MKLWPLFGRKKPVEEARDRELTIDQWATQAHSLFPFGGYGNPDPKVEKIDNDFPAYVNSAYKSSGVVFACCEARRSIFSEVRFAYQRMDRERPGDIEPGKGKLDVLEEPWENGTTGDLLSRAIQDVDMAGNHYAVREDRPGKPPRIRRLRPDWVEIILTGDPTMDPEVNIWGYIYKPGNTQDKKKWKVYPADGSNGAIAHWAPIPDPDAQFRGMSWMTPVLPEIVGDKAASKHKNKFFSNAATPNIAVALKETVSKDDFQEFVAEMNGSHKGLDNAYKTLYLGGGADVKVIGANMQQLDFKNVIGAGETRIAAAARVHPSIVGLSEGMAGSSLNEGNFQAAKDAFASGTMRPLWRSLCAAYSVLVDIPAGMRLFYDDREIAFLRDDKEKLARLEQMEATTISRLVMQGFTPESTVAAVLAKDWDLLEHTGLYSVQLLPPNVSNPDQWGDANKNGVLDAEEGEGDDKKPSDDKNSGGDKKAHSKANNNPTGSKRKPVGRPKSESKSNEWLNAVSRGVDWID
ncbi:MULTISPECIES: phage portal protein [Nocardia]|uniref:phage portal protein n=1 Tax=Nocardia TaxID=1817 RepID=UPI0007A37E41|nr:MULTISPECIES: phage portal protein [Nocardia]